jgi:hypothetical protein
MLQLSDIYSVDVGSTADFSEARAASSSELNMKAACIFETSAILTTAGGLNSKELININYIFIFLYDLQLLH